MLGIRFDRHCAGIGKRWGPSSAQRGPARRTVGAVCGHYVVQSSFTALLLPRPETLISVTSLPKLVEPDRKFVEIWQVWPRFGRNQRMLVEFGPNVVELRPNMVKLGPNLVEVGTNSAQIRPILSTPWPATAEHGPSWSKSATSGRLGPESGTNRAPIAQC